jgi:HlyD family secretion protein
MSTDVHSETRAAEDRPAAQDSRPHGRWWKRGLVAAGLVAVIATAAAFTRGPASGQQGSPKLTHTVRRGDLLVTVTEQGTLESSNNTEIKCKVRGFSVVTWVVPAGTVVKSGDELVRLDTKVIEEEVSLTKTNTFIATATLERSKADVAKAEIAIAAYKEGRFRSQLQKLEKELEANQRNLRTARTMLERSESLFRQGYVTELEVQGNGFTVTQAELELKVKETEIKVLNDYTRQMELETLQGNLKASQSKLAADEAGLAMETKRRNRAQEELAACVIKADRAGLVIYPSAAAWKRTPDITVGATVRKDQVLLLMPDLSKMQVKVGLHESIIGRIRPGLTAKVTLSDHTLEAQVSSVASVTRPAGWWTGNVVKYDTLIELPPGDGLRPGMSAAVEVILAVHEEVLTIPVAAVVETEAGAFCWVTTAEGGAARRRLQLGDSNDVFIVVQAGLKEGDVVALNPTAFLEEAQTAVRERSVEPTRPETDASSSTGTAEK